jgi:hypothetical protein
MAQFSQQFGFLSIPGCLSKAFCNSFIEIYCSVHPQFFKKAKILYKHQLESSQGTARFYTSIEEWLVEILFQNLRSILLEEHMKLQSLPDPCIPFCPCCTEYIQKIRTRVAQRVHEQLSQLCKEPLSGKELLRQHGKKAFKNAWKRYFGELKESKATLKSFSAAEVIAVQPEKAVLVIQSPIKGGEASVTPASSLDVDDLDAVMYD